MLKSDNRQKQNREISQSEEKFKNLTTYEMQMKRKKTKTGSVNYEKDG